MDTMGPVYFVLVVVLLCAVDIFIPKAIIKKVFTETGKVRAWIIIPFFLLGWAIQAAVGVYFYYTIQGILMWLCDLCVFLLPVICLISVNKLPNNIENNNETTKSFADILEEKANKRDVIYNGQRPDQEDYGFSMTNPICTSSIEGSNKYLSRLQADNGKDWHWTRKGSIMLKEVNGASDVIVDQYFISCGEEQKELYICPYGHNSEYAPKGFSLIPIIGEKKETRIQPAASNNSTLIEAPSLLSDEDNHIKFCRICGAKLEPDSIFCHKCGTKVKK